uniref:Neurotransmitter-gated ion-channel ligand-binding domain-containing protein n=1 Tax=Romanomermis culicivorax TaxID=13658 RepID=A0A915IUF3_ROMCU
MTYGAIGHDFDQSFVVQIINIVGINEECIRAPYAVAEVPDWEMDAVTAALKNVESIEIDSLCLMLLLLISVLTIAVKSFQDTDRHADGSRSAVGRLRSSEMIVLVQDFFQYGARFAGMFIQVVIPIFIVVIFQISTTLQQNETGYFRGQFLGNGQTSQTLRKILSDYDNFARPKSKTDPQKPTEITIWMRILDMTWKNDEIIFKMQTKRRWTDERLKFDAAQVEDKRVRSVRLFNPSIGDKSKIVQGVLDLTDIRYDRKGVNMTWPPNSPEACMIVHSEEKVRFEHIHCSKDYKTINGREKEILTASFSFIRKI